MNPDVPPTAVAADMPASTSSSAIPVPVQNYSPGINGSHQEDRSKRPAYYRMCVDSYADIDPRLDDASRRLLGVMLSLKRPDGSIIAGKEKLAFFVGKSPRRVFCYLQTLCAAGYLRLVKRGGGYPGNADVYALGIMYTKEKAEWCAKEFREKCQKWAEMEKERWSEMTGFKDEKWSGTDTKAGNWLPSHPIYLTTHTQDPLWTFNKENWMAYTENPALFAGWTREDRERCFDLAKHKGYETDETWRGCCAFYFKQWQKHNAKPQAPAAAARRHFTPAPRPAVRSSCESPGDPNHGRDWCIGEANRYWGFSPDDWRKGGEPNFSLSVYGTDENQEKAIAAWVAKWGFPRDQTQ